MTSQGVRVILNVDAITPPLTGIGRYALELARGLASHRKVECVRYFSAYRWVRTADESLQANRSMAVVRRYVPAKSLALRSYFALREAAFAMKTTRLHDHVLHAPNYLLFKHRGPKVTTVHDLSWMHYPEFHPVERVRIMNSRMPRTLAMADAIIVDSAFVGDEIVDHFGVERERVHVVPLGVDARFQPRSAMQTAPGLQPLGLRHGQYLLVVATLEPRKNLDGLLDAYLGLPEAVQRDYPMVVVGADGWRSRRLSARLDALARSARVRRLGFIAEDVLRDVIAGARLLAFPSVYEGFGLPPLEAMASGVPVVASSTSSVPEVTGNAALLVAPGDVEALRGALEKGLGDEEWRGQAVRLGLERASRFGWERCVDSTVDVYDKASERQ